MAQADTTEVNNREGEREVTPSDGDLTQSIPRTPAQEALKYVSVVMAILGGLVLLAGVLLLFAVVTLGVSGTEERLAIAGVELSGWSPLDLSLVTLSSAVLLLITARLGLAASRDASRVEAYRFLCYFVGLVLLVVIVWSWGAGTILIFNPIVLLSTVTYVVVCSSLGDLVKKEHDEGMRGLSYTLTGAQRALKLLSEVLVVSATLNAVVALVIWYALSQLDPSSSVAMADVTSTAGELTVPTLANGLVSAAVNLVVGLLGVRGANQPKKIGPFLVASVIGLASGVAQLLGNVAAVGGFGSLKTSALTDLLFYGACLYLSLKIRKQPVKDEAEEGLGAAGE
ncbi:MAG: hypothetical protein ACOYJL_05185 [Tractidigestivibacter sp.]|jgi:hypothetical protein|uniref:hypothetical protein n=1 Tax=Tractidigestivibacter sp. TaxID=2847320 RepID=UPI003D8F6C47